MGHCNYRSNKTEISLNQLYLLNKFGHDRYFATHPNQNSYFYLDINFATMMKTCSHELVHYIKFIKHGKSSYKSDLKVNNGKYNSLLAQEHKEFTRQISATTSTNNSSLALSETELKMGQNSSELTKRDGSIIVYGGIDVIGYAPSGRELCQRHCALSFPISLNNNVKGFLTSFVCADDNVFVDKPHIVQIGHVEGS